MPTLSTTDRSALIRRYADGPAAVDAALAGITDAELDASPGPGTWTARQVVHHLADSETRSYQRARRLLVEDEPRILGYDEERWADVLHYDRPIDASLAVFRAVRASTAELLARLGADDWARRGSHSESGAYGMEDWLRIYADHAHDHAEQISRARAAARADSGRR